MSLKQLIIEGSHFTKSLTEDLKTESLFNVVASFFFQTQKITTSYASKYLLQNSLRYL